MCALPQPRHGLVAQGPQAPLQVQGLPVRQVQPDRRAAAGHGRPGGAQAATSGRGRHCHGHPLHIAVDGPAAARAGLRAGHRRRGRARCRAQGAPPHAQEQESTSSSSSSAAIASAA